jgi:PAS domain S-box-containing protein
MADSIHKEDSQRILLALSVAAQNVMRTRSSENIYRVIANEIVGLGFQAGIFRLTEDGNYLSVPFLTFSSKVLGRLEKMVGVSASDYQIPLQAGSLYDRVIRGNQTVFLEDISVGVLDALPDIGGSMTAKILKLLKLKSAIYAPLVVSGEMEGMLFITGNRLVPDNIPAVTVFANQIATALENDLLIDEISRRELKFRQISENIIDGVAVAIDNRYYWVNSAFADMFGYTPEEMLGKGPELVIMPEGLEIFAERARKRAAGDTIPSRVEVPAVHKSGQHLDIQITPRQIKFDEQPAVQMIVRDITVSKQRQEQLKIFSRFIEASNQGFGIGTLDGSVQYANPTLLKMMAANHIDEVVGKQISEFYPPELGATFRDQIFPTVLDEGAWSGESTLVSKSGPIDVEEHYFLIRDELGNPQYIADVITDIRERKRTRAELERLVAERTQALKERETLLTALMDATQDTVALVDREGIILSINQSGAIRFGKTPHELIGLNVYALMSSDLAQARKTLIDQVFETAIPANFMDIRNGIHFKNAVYPILDPDSSLVSRVAIYASDISDRIRAENTIRENEDRLSKIMLAAKDGMWDWDLTSNDVYFDPRYYLMAGYEVDEFPHRLDEFQQRIHPDDYEKVMMNAQQHLDGEIDRFHVEFRFKQADGDWLWVLGRGVIGERDAEGIPLRFVGTHTDISERKLDEEHIRFQAEILKGVSDAIISVDEQYNIQSWNKAAEAIYGWNEIEVIGKSFVEIIKPDYLEKSQEQISSDLQTKGEFRGEVIHHRKDGTPFYALGSSQVILGAKGEITAIVGVYRDIETRKKAEQELADRMEELERFNRLAIGREMRVIELKQKINQLLVQLDREPEYNLTYIDE